MDDKLRQDIASFRYSLISPIVSRQDLRPGETMELIREAASRHYTIPGSCRTQVGERTIQRYLALYREGGLDALMPKPRKYAGRVPREALELAAALKRESPRRAISTIIDILESSGQVERGTLKRSTVYDYFTRLELTRPQQGPREVYRRYQAQHRNERWIGDVCHLTYLDDPENPPRKRKVYLIAWMDDYSRKIVHAQLYPAERMPALEDSLKKAIVTHGIPEQVYVDNGAIYSSAHFAKICGRLAIHLTHSRPYRPQGRGKIERFFLTVQRSFLPELEVVARSEAVDIAKANELFLAWLKNHYNSRRHSATKQAPQTRFDADDHPIRRADLGELYEAFLLEETRKVDKTGLFSLGGQTYETCPELAGRTVTVRFDPYDASDVRVFFEGKGYGQARPLHEPRRHAGLKPSSGGPKEPTGLNLLTSAPKEGMSYKHLVGGE